MKSFRSRDAENLLNGRRARKLPADIQKRAMHRLLLLAAAMTLDFLRAPPGNRLETLAGSRAGQHSIRINDQRRICFVWKDGDAYDVEIVDYH
ncbi:MAG: type II toxin-antitoxin system RelE/ParE family toxin [Alphaproteobacteria bacterium]|nr:type II toxin-antitoxin system RelE/ParE family toxin [Alphaproteobacteria bacterium]